MKSIASVLQLRTEEDNVFLAPAVTDVPEKTFGSHIAAQLLRAAQMTVQELPVHSFNAYFVDRVRITEPMVLEVERLCDGPSFSQRLIRAYQHGELKLTGAASFQRAEDQGPEYQQDMPEVPSPEDTAPCQTGLEGAGMEYEAWQEWEIRPIPGAPLAGDGTGFRSVWFRYKGPLPADDAAQRAALCYTSDLAVLPDVNQLYPEASIDMNSVDHALWFMRPVNVNEWLLYVPDPPSAHNGRTLTAGRVFSREGQLVACIVQENVTRY